MKETPTELSGSLRNRKQLQEISYSYFFRPNRVRVSNPRARGPLLFRTDLYFERIWISPNITERISIKPSFALYNINYSLLSADLRSRLQDDERVELVRGTELFYGTCPEEPPSRVRFLLSVIPTIKDYTSYCYRSSSLHPGKQCFHRGKETRGGYQVRQDNALHIPTETDNALSIIVKDCTFYT